MDFKHERLHMLNQPQIYPMGLFPTHFDRRFSKIIKHITILLVPIFGPYFGPYSIAGPTQGPPQNCTAQVGGVPSFLRDRLFVTKRVAVRVGNFLIGAFFFFRSTPSSSFPTQKIGFGAAGPFSLHLNFLTKNIFVFQIYFFGERPKS